MEKCPQVWMQEVRCSMHIGVGCGGVGGMVGWCDGALAEC